MAEAETIRERIDAVQAAIGAALARCGRQDGGVRLVAVTKTRPVETVLEVIGCGITDIGENRVQELAAKAPLVAGQAAFHLIGHLQRNKVKAALAHAAWIQSVDSLRLADEIDRQARAAGKSIDVLVEINTSGEAAKTGCPPELASELCGRVAASPAMRLRGLMTVGPLAAGESGARRSFAMLREMGRGVTPFDGRCELSMGMSGDYTWAVEEGATMVRIGSAILGERGGR